MTSVLNKFNLLTFRFRPYGSCLIIHNPSYPIIIEFPLFALKKIKLKTSTMKINDKMKKKLINTLG